VTTREGLSASGDAPELVFVYGELRRGAYDGSPTKGSDFVGHGEIDGELYLASGSPVLRLAPGKGRVTGDVVRMSPEQLRLMDESRTGGFQRVKTRVLLRDHNYEEVSAWVHEGQGSLEGQSPIPSGDWLIHTSGKRPAMFTHLTLLPPIGFLVAAGLSAFDFGSHVPETIWNGLMTTFLLGMTLSGFACAFVAEKRNEPMRALRQSMSVVSFCLLVFYFSGMVNG
jgi:gamma-glutamylcyclotransferase (GGCT)/AIG2-like uncharacterized protein YtfP